MLIRKSLRVPSRLPRYRSFARRMRSRSLPIVMYHGIVTRPLPVFNWCQVQLNDFSDQIEFLTRHYTVLPLTELRERLQAGAPLPPRAAGLTFDDGFRSVLALAHPVLARCQAPFTVFLVTGLIGTRRPAWPDQLYHRLATTGETSVPHAGKEWSLATPEDRAATYRALASELKAVDDTTRRRRLEELHRKLPAAEIDAESPLASLSWPEVEFLHRTGLASFGSHSHTHPILSRCSPELQREELALSRDTLMSRLGSAAHFAYPNGTRADFTSTTRKLVREAGYECALSTIPGLNGASTDPYELRRINVGADTGLDEFELLLLGC